jgi:hypothetical protein
MAIFLTQDQIYRMLQRELPEGVYPDGAASAFFSTAENDSVAAVAASGYASMSRIAANYFPATAVESIDDWVYKMFGFLFDASVDLATKRQRVIDKVRKIGSIDLFTILTIVAKYVPEGNYAQVFFACGADAQWELGVSLLGLNTYLAFISNVDVGITDDNINNWCSFISTLHWRLGLDGLGDTTYLSYIKYSDLASFQANAFLYEIRIYDYTIPPGDLAALEAELEAGEPARSAHQFFQNVPLAGSGLTVMVPNANQFSGVDTITRDPSSTTGYTGLTQ